MYFVQVKKTREFEQYWKYFLSRSDSFFFGGGGVEGGQGCWTWKIQTYQIHVESYQKLPSQWKKNIIWNLKFLTVNTAYCLSCLKTGSRKDVPIKYSSGDTHNTSFKLFKGLI